MPRKPKIDNKSIKPSRTLSISELSTLRDLLKDELNIHPFNDTDHEDAEILLDYAGDMIEECETVGHIVEEVSYC